jgi:DNA-binding SARP family transcriptional activator
MIERTIIGASGATDIAVARSAEDVSVRLPGRAPGGMGRGSTGQPVTGSRPPGLALAQLRESWPDAEQDPLPAARNGGREASSRPSPPQGRLRYQILGPLLVVNGDGGNSISARKVQVLLAAFLINSNLVVTVDRLRIEIWGNAAPRRAATALQVYVSQLRKFLGRAGEPDSPIVTCPSGYFLRVASDEVDLHTFTRLLQDGRRHARAGQHEDARATFEAALNLYRGPALPDLYGGPIVNQFVAWLEEARLECIELLNESELVLGRHREMVGNLYSLTVEHPFRETFYRQLMLALYRSERQADALIVYQAMRVILIDELGVEPCRRLRDLQRAILAADDRLDFSEAV